MNPQHTTCTEYRDSVDPCDIPIEQKIDSDSESEDEEFDEMVLALDPEYKPWDHVVVVSCDGFSQMLYLALEVLDNLVQYCDQNKIALFSPEHLAYYHDKEVPSGDVFSLYDDVVNTVGLMRQYVELPVLHTEEKRGEFLRTMAKESKDEPRTASYKSLMRFSVICYMRSMIERH